MILVYGIFILIALNYLTAFLKLQRGKFPVNLLWFYEAKDLDKKSLLKVKALCFFGVIDMVVIMCFINVSVIIVYVFIIIHCIIMNRISKKLYIRKRGERLN